MMRLPLFSLVFLAIASNGQDAGSKALPPPLRKYAASAATARGIRPNQEGKFQSLEVLWPVDVPVDYCYWRGSLLFDGAPGSASSGPGPGAAIAGSGMMRGKETLSLIFEGSVIGNAEKTGWMFQGLIGCDSAGREPGVSTVTKLTLQPSAFAKRAGLKVTSVMQIQTSPGSQGLAALDVRTDAADPAVFEFVDLPAGFQPEIETHPVPGGKGAIVTLFVDQTVRPGRYFLPVKVSVGASQGTGDVVVDVVPEQ